MRPKAEKIAQPPAVRTDSGAVSVYSSERQLTQPAVEWPPELKRNTRLKMDGLEFLAQLPAQAVPVAFLDPQYRGVLDYLDYGNEGAKRGAARSALPQMTESIPHFVQGIARALMPGGHLFFWLDKFHLCSGFQEWLRGTKLGVVDLVVWDKEKMGMGYRTRRTSEYAAILQKAPRRAKGVWKIHNIRDVWRERVQGSAGVHPKPVGLQGELLAAVSNPGDVVIDPAAGSFSVLEACRNKGREFLGCDVCG